MNQQIKIFRESFNKSRESFNSCYQYDILKNKQFFRTKKNKSYYHDILLNTLIYNQTLLDDIRTFIENNEVDENHSNKLSKTDKENGFRLIMSIENRIHKLNIKNFKTQNLINSENNRLSFTRDIFILVFSIIMFGVGQNMNVNSTEPLMQNIKSEIFKNDSILTDNYITELDSIFNLELDSVENRIETILLKLDSNSILSNNIKFEIIKNDKVLYSKYIQELNDIFNLELDSIENRIDTILLKLDKINGQK